MKAAAETADRHEKMLGGKCEAEWVSLFYYGLEAGTKMMLGVPIGHYISVPHLQETSLSARAAAARADGVTHRTDA